MLYWAMTTEDKANRIANILKLQYPTPKPPLNHSSALELLVATILSAQSTDVGVNKVTPILFSKYKTAKDYSEADQAVLSEIIKTINFRNNKAKNLIRMGEVLLSEFNGEVPDNMDELIKLPGVARKTANVVLGQWFHKNVGFAVDTHVVRLSQKYGLTNYSDPIKIEKDLMELFSQEDWNDMSLRFIYHGRQCCTARGSRDDCPLKEFYKN